MKRLTDQHSDPPCASVPRIEREQRFESVALPADFHEKRSAPDGNFPSGALAEKLTRPVIVGALGDGAAIIIVGGALQWKTCSPRENLCRGSGRKQEKSAC